MIPIIKEFHIQLTPEELASEFCELDCDQQARFFNFIASITSKWKNPLCFQLHNIMLSEDLTLEGRWVMEQIGIYSRQLSDQQITDAFKEETK